MFSERKNKKNSYLFSRSKKKNVSYLLSKPKKSSCLFLFVTAICDALRLLTSRQPVVWTFDL